MTKILRSTVFALIVAGLLTLTVTPGTSAKVAGPNCYTAAGRMEIVANLRDGQNRLYYKSAADRKRHRQYWVVTPALCRNPSGQFTRHPAPISNAWRACGLVRDRRNRAIHEAGVPVQLCRYVKAPTPSGGSGGSGSGGANPYLIRMEYRGHAGSSTCKGSIYATNGHNIDLTTTLVRTVVKEPNCPDQAVRSEVKRISVPRADTKEIESCAVETAGFCTTRIKLSCQSNGSEASCPAFPVSR